LPLAEIRPPLFQWYFFSGIYGQPLLFCCHFWFINIALILGSHQHSIKGLCIKREQVFVGILLNGKAKVDNTKTDIWCLGDSVYIMKLRFTMHLIIKRNTASFFKIKSPLRHLLYLWQGFFKQKDSALRKFQSFTNIINFEF
jgi:hypothetical protein